MIGDWPASHTMLILLGLCFTVTAVWGLYVLIPPADEEEAGAVWNRRAEKEGAQ